MKKLFAADLFCGAGGTSTGLAQACKELGIEVDLLAVNHWQIAIDTHTAAHPWARHRCASLDHLRPQDEIPSGRLHILAASPECTHHARARGGRPMNDQSRATAWHILKWAQEIYIDNILIENVPEFREWGPLGTNGKPLKSKKGDTFRAFIAALRSLGYVVEDRILNAADYGDPTTRKRLFIIARRGNKQIHWPEQTHSAKTTFDLFRTMKPYRTAREIIDWDVPSQSIFTRKKPLAPTTMARILAGLQKFNPQLEPFIVTLRQHVVPRSVDEPVPAVLAGGNHIGLAEFTLQQKSVGAPRSVDEPLATIATKGAISVVEPMLVKVTHGKSDDGRPQTTDAPLPSLTTKNGIGLAEAFLVQTDQTGFNKNGARTLDDPAPTIVTKQNVGLVEPYITKYYGTAVGAKSVEEPLETVTAKDRFALVQPEWNGYKLDIRFRMLQPHELAQAQGFPVDYPFSGNKSEITKQIGNAVPVNLAKALIGAMLEGYAPKHKSPEAPVRALSAVAGD